MPRYLIERRFSIGEDQMPEVGRRSRRIATDHFPEIVWEHSHVVVDESGIVKSFCVYEAPSEEEVRRHGEQLGQHDIVSVYELAGDVTPDDFPL